MALSGLTGSRCMCLITLVIKGLLSSGLTLHCVCCELASASSAKVPASPSLRGISAGGPVARGAGEEFGEDRGEGFSFADVGLAGQGLVAGAGQGLGEGPRGVLQLCGTFAACDDERRGGERGPPAGRQGAASLAAIHDRQVVRKGVRDSLE